MTLPTPHTLGVKRRIVGATGGHGNPKITYAAATDWLVHGVAPGASPRPDLPNRDATHIRWTIYAPVNAQAPTEHDRVVLDGEEYDLEAAPADWSKGPWRHPTAGLVVELIDKRG